MYYRLRNLLCITLIAALPHWVVAAPEEESGEPDIIIKQLGD